MPSDYKGDPVAFKSSVEPALADMLSRVGLKPSMAAAITAQLALETGHGRSINGNNFGNIKAGPGWTGETQLLPTTEYVDGSPVQKLEKFRKYSTPQEGLADYLRLLTSSPRYASALQARNPVEFFAALQKSGYATDPNYARKLEATFSSLYPS